MTFFSLQDFAYLSLIVAITYVINFYLNHFRRPNKLPGPLPLPIIGNLHQYNKDVSVWQKWLQSDYGDIGEVWFGGQRAIWLGRAEYLEKIFKPSASNYNLRMPPNEALDMMDMSSKGLAFNRDLDKCNINRKNFMRAVTSPTLLGQSVKFLETLFSEMEKYLEDLMQRNIEIDMCNWTVRFFEEAIFLIAANKKCAALENYYRNLCSPEKNATETESLASHSRIIFKGIDFFMMTPKFLHILPSYNERAKKYLNSFDWVRKYYLRKLIKERREEIERTPHDQELTHDMLTLMITFNTSRDKTQGDKSFEPISDDDICELIFEVILGGMETVSSTFGYIVYYICQHPEVKQRVFEEIQKVFCQSPNISYEELSKLHYCEAVIKEVARLKPTIPLITRMVENADEINGHKFEGSTQLFINIQEIHINKSHWKDPEKFDPERFLSSTDNNNKNDVNEIKKNSFLMFGGGMRICPGRNLAMAELKTLMVLLFGKYDVELVDNSAPLKNHYTSTSHCDELKVKLVKKKDLFTSAN